MLVAAAAAIVTYEDRTSEKPTENASSSQPASGAVANAPDGVEPEGIYTSLPNNITCPTEEALAEFVQHASAGEKTLALQMLAGNGGPCLAFPAGVKVHILHVDPTQFIGHKVVEFNLAENPNSGGYWALDRLVKK